MPWWSYKSRYQSLNGFPLRPLGLRPSGIQETPLAVPQSPISLPYGGLYPARKWPVKKPIVASQDGQVGSISGVLNSRDLVAVTIARGSAQGIAAPQEAWSYAERW